VDELTQTIRNATAAIQPHANALATAPKPAARDWAGFFAALAEFAKVLAPIIAAFFTKK
jgi:hypothetical protein